MRITREILLKVARDTAVQRARQERDLLCIYLTGSLLGDAPLLGGTTDVDLVFVHNQDPLYPREVVRMNEEVHLDIAHYSQLVYHQPRHLRLSPWVGSYLCSGPLLLFELKHWFEFTQSSVAAQFFQPESVMGRARPLAESARQLWLDLESSEAEPGPRQALAFYQALERAANAVAMLSGAPLTERRFMAEFPHRAVAIDRPDLASALVGLVTNGAETAPEWKGWIDLWQQAFTAAGHDPSCPVRIHPCRRPYYQRAISALSDELPAAALWMLLRTWTLALANLPDDHPAQSGWSAPAAFFGLSGAEFTARLQALDGFLDLVEEALDVWAQKNGA